MEGMYMFPPHGERKKKNIFTAEISVFLRETNTSTIFTRTFYFFPFIFLSYIKRGQFAMKGFHYNIDKKKKEKKNHILQISHLCEGEHNEPEVGKRTLNFGRPQLIERETTRGAEKANAPAANQKLSCHSANTGRSGWVGGQ